MSALGALYGANPGLAWAALLALAAGAALAAYGLARR